MSNRATNVTASSRCRLCPSETLTETLDFGSHPLCNRFLARSDEKERAFPLRMGFCENCGVVQLIDPPPPADVKSRLDWITYNEPEGHLDRLVEILTALPGLPADASVGALTGKDDSTVRRLAERGFKKTWRVDMRRDLNIDDPSAGLETIQDRLTPAAAKNAAARLGRADLLIVRHVFEHVHRMSEFIGALKEWLKPGGRIVFEIPDCQRALDKKDYSTLWEEHAHYFTPAAFRGVFPLFGLSVERFESFPYPLENSLVAIVKDDARGAAGPAILPDALKAERARFAAFAQGLDETKKRVRAALTAQRSKGPVAFLGAGHVSCMFVNVFGVKDLIDFFVDDHPRKRGLFMPGSRLPILGSEALVKRNVHFCLLGVSPESEVRVLEKNKRFIENGGRFSSIFPDVPNALRLDGRP